MKRLLIVFFLAGIVLISGCTEEKSTDKAAPDNNEPLFVLVPQAADLTDGSSGDISIPLVGLQVLETDVKKHWDMPGNMSLVSANVTFESTGWDLDVSIGTGECPDSGTELASEHVSGDSVIVQYFVPDNGTLEEGQWFVHIRTNDATDHRGESLGYNIEVTMFSWQQKE